MCVLAAPDEGCFSYAGRRRATRSVLPCQTRPGSDPRSTAGLCDPGHATHGGRRRRRLHACRAASVRGSAAVRRFSVYADATFAVCLWPVDEAVWVELVRRQAAVRGICDCARDAYLRVCSPHVQESEFGACRAISVWNVSLYPRLGHGRDDVRPVGVTSLQCIYRVDHRSRYPTNLAAYREWISTRP